MHLEELNCSIQNKNLKIQKFELIYPNKLFTKRRNFKLEHFKSFNI